MSATANGSSPPSPFHSLLSVLVSGHFFFLFWTSMMCIDGSVPTLHRRHNARKFQEQQRTKTYRTQQSSDEIKKT